MSKKHMNFSFGDEPHHVFSRRGTSQGRVI